MTDALQGLTVVLTRPVNDNKPLAAQIDELGGKVIHWPSLEIIPINQDALKQTIQHLTEFDKVIFLSKNAVRLVAPLWPTNQVLPQVIAIGPSTSKLLADYNIDVYFDNQMEVASEGLLAFSDLINVQKQKILIFKGEGGRDLLSTSLQARGALVHEVAVYRRSVPTKPSDFFAKPSPLSLLFNEVDKLSYIFVVLSCETLKNLHEQFKGSSLYIDFLASHFLVGSSRIAQFAETLQHPVNKIIQSQSPLQGAILEKLIAWYSKVKLLLRDAQVDERPT